MRIGPFLRAALGAVCLALLSQPSFADELKPGYFEVRQISGAEWSAVWKAPLKGGIAPDAEPLFPAACEPMADPLREVSGQTLVSRWSLRCEGDLSGQRIGLQGFYSGATDVLLRVHPLDAPPQVRRLTLEQPVATIAARPSSWQVSRSYTVLGIEHILFGYDHLLFVFAMVLLIGRGWAVVKAVTAFTVAHSVTLVGTTLGLVGLPQRPVEAAIALSILFLAVEIVKQSKGEGGFRLSGRVPWLIAFAFGLLHGFGFAGALAEIGLPEGEVAVALFAFNVGVELGQLAIVMAALILIAMLRRYAAALVPLFLRTASYAIGIVASFWFFERTLV